MAALESLIMRCQELELQAHERDDVQFALQQQLMQQTQHLQQLQASIQAMQTVAPPRTLLDNSPHSSRRLRHSLSSSAHSHHHSSSSMAGEGATSRARSAGPDERALGRYSEPLTRHIAQAQESPSKQRVRQQSSVVHNRSWH